MQKAGLRKAVENLKALMNNYNQTELCSDLQTNYFLEDLKKLAERKKYQEIVKLLCHIKHLLQVYNCLPGHYLVKRIAQTLTTLKVYEDYEDSGYQDFIDILVAELEAFLEN